MVQHGFLKCQCAKKIGHGFKVKFISFLQLRSHGIDLSQGSLKQSGTTTNSLDYQFVQLQFVSYGSIVVKLLSMRCLLCLLLGICEAYARVGSTPTSSPLCILSYDVQWPCGGPSSRCRDMMLSPSLREPTSCQHFNLLWTSAFLALMFSI